VGKRGALLLESFLRGGNLDDDCWITDGLLEAGVASWDSVPATLGAPSPRN
jgi:hypothetical protein